MRYLIVGFKNKFDEYLSKQSDFGSTDWLDIKNEDKYRLLKKDLSKYLTLAISTRGFEGKLSYFLAQKFNHNKSIYDKVIDAPYNETNIGGSILHRNLDGSHTWTGAIKELKEAFPEESEFNLAYHALIHLGNDFTTSAGINPFLSPQEFEQAKQFLTDSFHIPKSYTNDLLNLNLTELCGTAVATIGLILDFNDLQTQKLGQYVSRLSLSSYIAGNPAMLLLTSLCLGQACYMLWQGHSVLDFVDGIFEGGVNAGTFFYVSSLFTPEIFIGLTIGVAACFCVNWVYKEVKHSIKDDLDEIFESQFKGYRSYLKLIS